MALLLLQCRLEVQEFIQRQKGTLGLRSIVDLSLSYDTENREIAHFGSGDDRLWSAAVEKNQVKIDTATATSAPILSTAPNICREIHARAQLGEPLSNHDR